MATHFYCTSFQQGLFSSWLPFLWLARAWFLRIASVRELLYVCLCVCRGVCVCVCVCVCVLVLGGILVFLARYGIDVAPVLS